MRDLPMPASPMSRTHWPSPALAWRQRSRIVGELLLAAYHRQQLPGLMGLKAALDARSPGEHGKR